MFTAKAGERDDVVRMKQLYAKGEEQSSVGM